MIEIKHLSKSFPPKLVLSDVSLTVADGSVCGLVGINGAGKSTLLRLIAGVLKPDEGDVLFDREPVFENPKAKRPIFFLADEPFSTPFLTPKKLTEAYSTFYGFSEERLNDCLAKFRLDPKQSVSKMSKGMKRQLYISLALATDCKAFLLDEAFDGLDPLARLTFKRLIIERKEAGCSFILSSHSLRELEDIADSYALLDATQLKCQGSIVDDIGKLCKFQIAFDREITESEIPFPCVLFHTSGRVATVIAKGDERELTEKLNAMSPLLLDQIPIDFEEFFLSNVEKEENS